MTNESQPIAPLAGNTAVVTGASSGIGRAIALQFADAGANVVVHAGQNREAAEQVAALIAGDFNGSTKSHVIIADISVPEDRQRLIDDAFAWADESDRPLTIWVNNAGADVLTGEAAKWSFEDKLARLGQVDVGGTIALARAAGERMKSLGSKDSQRGVIINMGWDQAATGQAGDSGELFAATKGAVMAFSRSLAKSLAPSVRVNCLAPGWIQTAWGDSVSESGGYWDDRARGESLVERWGTPEDVAAAALFLASPAGAFINGHVLPVNGGAQPWPRQLTERPTQPGDES